MNGLCFLSLWPPLRARIFETRWNSLGYRKESLWVRITCDLQGSLGPRQEKVSEKALSIDVFMVYSTRELGDVSGHEGCAEIHRLADNHGPKEVLSILRFNKFR